MYDQRGTVTISIKEYNELRAMKDRIIKLKNTTSAQVESKIDLTQKDIDVLEFIRANPRCSKQRAVDGLRHKYARATIWKIINQLLHYGFLVAKPDSHNRQKWNLFVDATNALVQVSDEVNLIETLFSSLTSELHKDQADLQTEIVATAFYFLLDLSFVYTYLVNMYFIYALTEWPQIKDKSVLDKLYAILFTKLVNILQMLSDVHETYVGSDDFNSNTANELLFRSDVPYLLQQSFIINMREKARILSIENYLDSLLDVVWKIGYNIFKKRVQYTDLGILDIDEYKDWRQFLEIDVAKSGFFMPIENPFSANNFT